MQQRSHRVSSEAEELVFKGDLSQVSLDHHPETQLSVEPGKSVKVSLVERVSTSDEQPRRKCLSLFKEIVSLHLVPPDWIFLLF